ncbi:hypothetical protein A2W24_03010 [Microgenomates group bacterium RBG_16_45_19]|nr:MAG: hypothetical protein A2W24_03010 [Microgenomates group bacterium RBG_16_45_19]
MANPVSEAINRHYLQVQALTPASAQTTFGSATSTPSIDWFSLATPAFIVFTALLIVGIIGLLLTHTKNINKLLVVISIAFLTSLVPVSLNLVNQQASLVTKAGAGDVPTQVLVDQVTPTGFDVSWQTDNPSVGAIRLREPGQPPEYNRIIAEDQETGIYTHIIRVTDLRAATTYAFEVLSGGNWYNDQGQPLLVTTRSP